MDKAAKDGVESIKNVGKEPTLMDKAGGVAISVRDSAMGAGKVVQETAQSGVDCVKNAVAPKK